MSDTLNSPQGDGNQQFIFSPNQPFLQSDTLNSPQGDGNGVAGGNVAGLIPGQTPSIPRKGTETQYDLSQIPKGGQVRHPQFPARGRKLEIVIVYQSYILKSDTLNSPQGDGNVRLPRTARPDHESQTPSIPRKGTETASNFVDEL